MQISIRSQDGTHVLIDQFLFLFPFFFCFFVFCFLLLVRSILFWLEWKVFVKRVAATAQPADCHNCVCSLVNYHQSWTDCRLCTAPSVPDVDLVTRSKSVAISWWQRPNQLFVSVVRRSCRSLGRSREMPEFLTRRRRRPIKIIIKQRRRRKRKESYFYSIFDMNFFLFLKKLLE